MKQIALAILVTMLVVIAGAYMNAPHVDAEDGLPPSVTIFQAGDHTCVVARHSNQGIHVECFCPCAQSCGTVIETSTEPTPNAPTPTAVPTIPAPHCDQGRGNGDDGCSPGNSDNQHGPNDPQRGPRN